MHNWVKVGHQSARWPDVSRLMRFPLTKNERACRQLDSKKGLQLQEHTIFYRRKKEEKILSIHMSVKLLLRVNLMNMLGIIIVHS